MTRDILPPTQGQRWAVLSFAGLRLSVPLAEVHSLSSVLELDRSAARLPVLGHIELNGTRLETIGFDAELNTLSAFPGDYRVCVNLGVGSPELGILCQSVETLEHGINEQALPECMASNDSMVTGVALYEGEVLLCTGIEALARHLASTAQWSGQALGITWERGGAC